MLIQALVQPSEDGASAVEDRRRRPGSAIILTKFIVKPSELVCRLRFSSRPDAASRRRYLKPQCQRGVFSAAAAATAAAALPHIGAISRSDQPSRTIPCSLR